MNFTAVTKLSGRQLWWLVLAWWRLWAVAIQLKLKGAPWLMGYANQRTEDVSAKPALPVQTEIRQKAKLMHESVRLAERCHPLSIACLGKSLVLFKMLRRRKASVVLRIGVHLSQSGQTSHLSALLSSHAWVEIDGVAVAEATNVQNQFVEVSNSQSQAE